MHTPVLLQEAVDSLRVKKGGLYIDATFGEGGHTQEILNRGGKVLGIDLDEKQIFTFQFSVFKEEKKSRLRLVQGNFKDIEKIAKENGFYPVDGVLIDLGLSMAQINQSGRGFSYRQLNEPLDMRLDPGRQVSAEFYVNSLNEEELYEIFSRYSEELNSRAVAQSIVFRRHLKKIKTVGDLIAVIDRTLKTDREQTYRRIFQALRIKVNNEFENLKQVLAGSSALLNKEGRIVIISFHSLEDRIIKNFIKQNQLCQVNKKVIFGNQSLRHERSAKLRIISKK